MNEGLERGKRVREQIWRGNREEERFIRRGKEVGER